MNCDSEFFVAYYEGLQCWKRQQKMLKMGLFLSNQAEDIWAKAINGIERKMLSERDKRKVQKTNQ